MRLTRKAREWGNLRKLDKLNIQLARHARRIAWLIGSKKKPDRVLAEAILAGAIVRELEALIGLENLQDWIRERQLKVPIESAMAFHAIANLDMTSADGLAQAYALAGIGSENPGP
jgi:hypothetical protein